MVLESIGPGWVMHDISEIKPGSFTALRSMEAEYDTLRVEDVRSKATTDPMYKYVKRLLPKPREPKVTSKRERPDLEENYKNPKPRGLKYETSDKGHSLMQKYIQDLAPERLTQLSTDTASLKKELREAARKETEEMKSKIKPTAAHKVYAWRDLLEEKEPKSHSFSYTQVPSEVFLPDQTKQMLNVYHKDHENVGKVKRMNGYWQIPRLGPPVTRDRYGLRILTNLELEEDLPTSKRTAKVKEYHYSWPLVDTNTGDSIQDWVKQK